MKARFLKAPVLRGLESKIADNLAVYRSGSFASMEQDPESYFESELEVDLDQLATITGTSTDANEVACCLGAYNAFTGITAYLARDERLWTYLTHAELLEYTRTRWPIPDDDEKAIKHIKAHFFCIGARGIERDNAISRLWWMAYLCHRSTNLSLQDALTCFLFQSDVRANIVERPTTSQNVTIFSAILAKLSESYSSDRSLFGRERFRAVMKRLNLKGGVKLLAALPKDVVFHILDECIAEAA